MSFFSNEYIPQLNRSDTNIYVGKFINKLLTKLIKENQLTLCIPPLACNQSNSFINLDTLRTIDFDNTGSNQIFQMIDSIDKWIYWYIRECSPDVNEGIICLNHQINRDADFENGKLIATPYLTFSASLVRTYYSYDFLLKQVIRVINLINETIQEIEVNGFKSQNQIGDYQVMTAKKLVSMNKKLRLTDLLVNQVQQQPLFVTETNRYSRFQDAYPQLKNALMHPEIHGSFFHRSLYKDYVLDFFNIGFHQVYENLDFNTLNYGPYYQSRLDNIYKNAEWTYVIHLNLANILLWVLDKQNYSEIFSGAYPDELYENAIENKRELL